MVMEETAQREGFFSRIAGWFHRSSDEEEAMVDDLPPRSHRAKSGSQYHVTVRRQIVSFQDAVSAADGLKRGEQQILNLSLAPAELREKIKDFMCGVNYAAEGTWEELGEAVYLLAPIHAFVEVAPASPRMHADRN